MSSAKQRGVLWLLNGPNRSEACTDSVGCWCVDISELNQADPNYTDGQGVQGQGGWSEDAAAATYSLCIAH